jgi:ABC-type Mn2+/Zn2+ transport system permease subunit
MDVLELMALPALECLILVGIHSYLGLHVIRRRVIFVDLALAQIAALGTTVGFVFGLMPDTVGGFTYSLTFCLIGAALFAFTRLRDDRVPQEAVIGLVYAITAALAILVVQKTKGAEHMESILVGSLLWVSWRDVLSSGLAYSVIGVIHYVFRKPFMLISDDPKAAYAKGMNVRLWDFLFYVTFGIVITFSVRVAGVLLVFVFLVAPAILATLITQKLRDQLLIGWGAGTVVTVLGLYVAYVIDLPVGPTVVAFYAVVLALSAAVVQIHNAAHRLRAVGATVLGTLAILALGYGLFLEGEGLALLGGVTSGHGHGHAHASPVVASDTAPASLKGSADTAALETDDADDPEALIASVAEATGKAPRERLLVLLSLLEDEEVSPFYREEALSLFKELSGEAFAYQADAEPGEDGNRAALRAMRRHMSRLVKKPHPHAAPTGLSAPTR